MLIDPAQLDRALSDAMARPDALRRAWRARAIHAAIVIQAAHRRRQPIQKLGGLAYEMGVSYCTARRAWADLRRAMNARG